jgi:sec-independent protein translocase protein TatA
MFPNLGMSEVFWFLVIALVIFGPGKLPEMGKALGKTHERIQKGLGG